MNTIKTIGDLVFVEINGKKLLFTTAEIAHAELRMEELNTEFPAT